MPEIGHPCGRPSPFEKLSLLKRRWGGSRTELRVQIAAFIKRNGRIDGLSLLRSLSPDLEQTVIQDLASWEFKPATRDGVPVDVDVVFEIPFSLPPEVARHGGPNE